MSGPQPEKQIAQIEKSVTHLLVATKQLLETLTQWSRRQATEGEVSDVYVRLGYEFNLACRAFNSIGVETADLGPVPELLREILEDTLSQDASPQSLDQYLPKIRDIIINLLQGLKRKQAKLRSRSNRETRQGSSGSLSNRQGSSGSLGETGSSQKAEQMPVLESRSLADDASGLVEVNDTLERSAASTPDRTTRSGRDVTRTESRNNIPDSNSSSSLSSITMQNMPVVPPYADTETSNIPIGFPPPPPPPKQQDALAALQKGGDLERRASRRFSAYQVAKHLGASPNGVTVLPPSQNSPIPNRGRDMRESLNAVRSRGSFRHSRQKSSTRLGDYSPSRPLQPSEAIAEEAGDPRVVPIINPPEEIRFDDSPTVKTPEDEYGPPVDKPAEDVPPMTATLNGPLPSMPEAVANIMSSESEPEKESIQIMEEQTKDGEPIPSQEGIGQRSQTPPQSGQFTPEQSPPLGKELTLFLQYRSKIKKFVLPEGYSELTVARLQLAFIEKFAWNTHNNGVDLPEIYIQDPISGVRHELEDLNDVKDRCVLVLNVEILDEVKKHIDDGLGGIRRLIEGVRGAIDGQESLMQRFSERQLETAKDMARMAATPPPAPAVSISKIAATKQPGLRSTAQSSASLSEVQSLRREIAVLRQSYSTMASDFTASLQNIKAKGANVQKLAASAIVPGFAGNAGRVHVEDGKKQLLEESENLVNRVDDLSDLVEDLRKDVVTRGVRPLPRQLEDVSKDISLTVKELTKVKDFIKRERPVWTKIWEKELNQVCQERDELTQQEDLMADLTGDLEDLSGVFKLVEEATKQQNLQSSGGNSVRTVSRNLPTDSYVDPQRAKDGVLGEVRALQPNHENRLEAIERAEKARQRELESRRGGEFQREVERFVEEGKLKKTGGAEEVERLRRKKDEEARRENWERAAARRAGMEEREALSAAQQAPLPESNSSELHDTSEVQDKVERVSSGETSDRFEEAAEAPTEKAEQPGTSDPSGG
ncbi:putative actin-interacting protein [Phaeomoniella chlamydospora]|uniref:Putative actin-interacting protein n=1 Tax=Phaeomoniella chlamydospora TaxID=158046 RepID=A0A0G2EMC2_PHACM|nr:putative actin-interacting protein [Phaeomoniella chlamydospora]